MAAETCNVHDFVLSASALSSHNLDLSRKGIRELPDDLPGCEKLECLYLEGNKLSTLPESLFVSCPNLKWLDLRNNQLIAIPPCIDKLRHLRTLLLEGNRLTSLPPQMSRLKSLTGLNLANNPLEMPPKHIVQRGTKEILKYLREVLNGIHSEEDCGLVDNNSKSSSTVSPESRSPLTLAPIDRNTSLIQSSQHSTKLQPESKASKLDLPLPVLQQIPLSGSRHQPRKGIQSRKDWECLDQTRPSLVKRKKRAQNKIKEGASSKDFPLTQQPSQELSFEEKLEISIIIEKKKAKDSLAAWRDEAKELQRKHNLHARVDASEYQRPKVAAPYATDHDSANKLHSEMDRLKVTDQQTPLSESSTDSLRDVREAEVRARVNKHMLELAALRKQTGIIASPSDELLDAEKKLAEAIVRRKELERETAREYRLTAFTGDML